MLLLLLLLLVSDAATACTQRHGTAALYRPHVELTVVYSPVLLVFVDSVY